MTFFKILILSIILSVAACCSCLSSSLLACDHKCTRKPEPFQVRLQFAWACRYTSLKYCHFKVVWNNQVIKDIYGKDYSVHKEAILLKGSFGSNNLTFLGKSGDSTYGVGVDKVSVIEKNSNRQLIKNGDFSQPSICSSPRTFMPSQVPYWVSNKIEIGVGTAYSKYWCGYGQVLELQEGDVVTQMVNIDSNCLETDSFQQKLKQLISKKSSQSTVDIMLETSDEDDDLLE